MIRISKSVFAVVGTAIAIGSSRVWAQGPSGADGYAYGNHMIWAGGGWAGMIFGPLVMILVLAAVVALAALLVRWLGGPLQGSATYHHLPPVHTPLDILKERYAHGEIDKEEFEERRRILGE